LNKDINDRMLSIIPKSVMKISETLNAFGHEAYIVGGAVRDSIIGIKVPVEWDMTTSAKPEEIVAIFDKVYLLGAKYGTVTVIMDQLHVEVTTYRKESGYKDKRHPEEIDFISNIGEDLARRDFRMNAIAFDPINSVLLDPFLGINDIENKVINTVGNPRLRFLEDGLRMMRAVRLSAVLGYEIEETTKQSIRELSANIGDISSERIRDEVIKIIESPNPHKGMHLLEETGLLDQIFPSLLDKQYFGEACALLKDLSRKEFDIGIAAFAIVMRASIEDLLKKLKLSKRENIRIKKLVKLVLADYEFNDSEVELRKLAVMAGRGEFQDVIYLKCVLKLVDQKIAELALELQNSDFAFGVSELKVSGTDLINECGIEPGIHVKVLLDTLLAETVEKKIENSYEELILRAKELLKPI
jgi:tRNA nucleotidyltransferase/poly(A) polymerase